MLKIAYLVLTMKGNNHLYCLLLLMMILSPPNLTGQVLAEQDSAKQSLNQYSLSSGWADEAAGIGYVAAPSVLVLTLVSGVVNEWNAGYFGIPASALILAAPPVIFLGGRSADIPKELFHPRAKLAWTLYALSIIPTSLALYSYTTDWGASVPLMITSGILGSASIVAMTTYAFARANEARDMKSGTPSAWNFGIAPLQGGAIGMLSYRF